MSLQGGDQLASGAKSAKFSTATGLSSFEDDLIFRPEIVSDKYDLSQEEVDAWQGKRIAGETMPNLRAVADVEEDNASGVVVNDRRTQYELSSSTEEAKVVEQKYPEAEYTAFAPILDRILVMRVPLDKNLEVLEDGSVRDKRTKFIVPAKYRQHSNTGIVLAVGNFVVMGGQRIELDEIVRPGDRVTFGDYNSELFPMPKERVLALCDAISVNYFEDEQGLRIVRIQDVRGIESPINESLAGIAPLTLWERIKVFVGSFYV
jgi:co-chaperonin GroES (HSP10)